MTRATNIETLARAGFVVAPELPTDEDIPTLRPTVEIAKRFLALEALYCWCGVDPNELASDDIKVFVAANHLETWLTEGEKKLLAVKRSVAVEKNAATIGWRLENMWALAWVLGFDPAPGVDGQMIAQDTARAVVVDFAGGLGTSLQELVARAAVRPVADVIAMEDLFFCAHNAVAAAQAGAATVPAGFDAVIGGGVVFERRHALTWCLSPGIDWDDTNVDPFVEDAAD